MVPVAEKDGSAIEHPINNLLLWLGMLGGGVAWLMHLLLSYSVAEFGCASRFSATRALGVSGVVWMELGVSLFALALGFGACLVARRNQHRFGEALDWQDLGSADARPFIAHCSLFASGLFLFIILVQSIPLLFYLRGC